LLADFFARRMAREMVEDFPGFAPSAIEAIEAHDWPGNVRELRNFAQRITARALIDPSPEPVRFDPRALDPFESPWRPPPVLNPTAQPPSPAQKPDLPVPELGAAFDVQTRLFETALIDAALAAHDGHQGRAAEMLGLTYHQLRGLLKKHDYGRKPGKPEETEPA
jgi:psp operon transcriptional activator